nr:unnamed protein product [Callosobruchus chinensis]
MSSQNSEEKSADIPSTTDDTETPSSSSSAAENPGLSLSMEQLRRYLAEKLGFYDEDSSGEREKIKILDNVNLDGIVEHIKNNNCRNIITMAGAAAGIPDFRSPGTGLYDNLQKYNLPHPQAIFELDFFHENPKPFFVLAKELYPGSFKPTVCHYFIKMLAEKELLLRHYTQNIDTLERVAGIPDDKIDELKEMVKKEHELIDQKNKDTAQLPKSADEKKSDTKSEDKPKEKKRQKSHQKKRNLRNLISEL